MNIIPGAAVIGCGFNSLGVYGISSVKQRIFKDSPSKETYTFNPTSIEYRVPENVAVVDYVKTVGTSQVFTTKKSFENHFSQKAGIHGNYGAFSAQFSEAYSSVSKNISDYYYALYESSYLGWKAVLKSHSIENLDPSVVNDPCYQNIPGTFTKDNQELFFSFFRKYGTHYVSQVSVGGNMTYYSAIERTFSSNMKHLEINVELEYKALFLSVKAKSHTEWETLTKKWSENRVSSLQCVGGDAGGLDKLDPSYGDSDDKTYAQWSDSVTKNPAVVDYVLSPINNIFLGEQAKAVDKALDVYLNAYVRVDSSMRFDRLLGRDGCDFVSSSTITVSGDIIKPNPDIPKPKPHKQKHVDEVTVTGGLKVALIDPNSLEVLQSKVYYQKIPFTERAMYKDAMKDIEEFESSKQGAADYICAVSAFALDLEDYPIADFAAWLVSCGAEMKDWKTWIGYTSASGNICYSMVGRKGLEPGLAREDTASKVGMTMGSSIESLVFKHASEDF